MNLRSLEYLVALAEHRHFGRAAEACYVSQPTLSVQLRKLEQELGVELIERAPRQVLLTRAGEQVVERARTLLQEAGAIRAIASQARDPGTATLQVGLFPTLAPYLLPHAMPVVRARFPRLELLLVEEKTAEVLRRLHSGELDAGVLARPVDDDGQFIEHVLFEEDFVLAVPADHPLADAEGPVPTGALAREGVLLLEDGHCLRDQAMAVCEMAGAVEHRDFRATSLETLRQMVAAGAGVTLLPELAVQPPVPASPGIRLLRFAEPVPRRQIAMYWRPTSPYWDVLAELAAAFADLPPGLLHHSPAAAAS